jgi:two-component system sensor histidine kinase MprB
VSAPDPRGGRISRSLSLRGRVAALTAVLVAVTVTAVALAAFLFVRSQVQDRFDQDLLVRARSLSALDLGGIQAAFEAFGDDNIAILNPDGSIFARSHVPPPVSAAERAVAIGMAGPSVRGDQVGGADVRVAVIGLPRGGALVISAPVSPIRETLRTLAFLFVGIGAAGIALAAVVGLLVARAGLRPVERLTEAAEYIARTEDLTPIPVTGDDELARLTSAFNAMLLALDTSRSQQRQLVADAGHELRTPLTSLRTNLDLLAQSSAGGPVDGGVRIDAAEEQAMLSDLRAQVEELGVLIGDLVELSRDDGQPFRGQSGRHVEQVDLADVVDRSVERVRRRAPGLTFDVRTSGWELSGEPASLERAVTNLLDNAAKWSPAGGTVAVRLAGGTLTVADEGPGIAEADLPRVFERFYRSADARSMPGSGLGLAIVAQTIARHGGTVTAAPARVGWDGNPGTLITVHLPGHPVGEMLEGTTP